MKTFTVVLEERRYYTIEVEAKDEEQAIDLAHESEKYTMNEFDNDEMETDVLSIWSS